MFHRGEGEGGVEPELHSAVLGNLVAWFPGPAPPGDQASKLIHMYSSIFERLFYRQNGQVVTNLALPYFTVSQK